MIDPLGPPLVSPATIDEHSVGAFVQRARRLESVVGTIVVGQEDVVRQTVIALLAGGHVLLEGAPGLGKTLLVRTLAAALDLSFSRVQFTPDLMPADITGTTILREDEFGRRSFVFQPGPLFAHVVLADEVNRATPKTQSALLEAMQDRTVTAGNDTHTLPTPFFVLATQNPLEMEGTYPLPEAQLDRFVLKVLVPFPNAGVLRRIIEQTLQPSIALEPVLDADTLAEMLAVARAVPIAAPVLDYAIAVVTASHPDTSSVPSVHRFVRAGISPRGLQALVVCAQVRALLEERYHVSTEDLRALAPAALRHRLLLNFEAQADGVSADSIIADILQTCG